MSGKQAKAKRKSAKKTAKSPTLAPIGARLEEFVIGNVRCFAGEQRVPIRPITLLVGENSTGKTTFMGCYRRFVDMFSTSSAHVSEGTFARPPFYMGGFLDIARKVGSGKRKPREFFVGGVANRPGRIASPLSLVYSFREENGEAVPYKLSFGFPDADELVVENLGLNHEWGQNILMLGLRGPGFECMAITPDLLKSEMDYNQMLGCINMGYSQFVLPEVAARKSFTFADIVRSRDGDNPNKDTWKAWNFVKAKFDGGNEVSQFIPLRNAMMNFGDCVAIAPIRPMPRRNYEPEVSGIAEERLLVEMSRMSRSSHANPFKWDALRRQLDKFGEESGMFSSFNVKHHGEGADAPFSLRVNIRGVDVNIADVGYGVSQLLPFLGRVVQSSREEKSKHFLFQQPEDHLHPRAQAEFASFVAKWAKLPVDWRNNQGHTFLVETHSDFIVDRIRTHVARGDLAPSDVALLYFEPQKSGGAVKIHRIELNRKGEPVSPPKGYREFFLRETERVLGLRKD